MNFIIMVSYWIMNTEVKGFFYMEAVIFENV